jgi:hypothetical protein
MTKMADEKTHASLPEDVIAALAEALPPIPPTPEREAAMRERVLARVRADRARLSAVRAAEGEWTDVAPGVTLKLLHRDADTETDRYPMSSPLLAALFCRARRRSHFPPPRWQCSRARSRSRRGWARALRRT